MKYYSLGVKYYCSYGIKYYSLAQKIMPKRRSLIKKSMERR